MTEKVHKELKKNYFSIWNIQKLMLISQSNFSMEMNKTHSGASKRMKVTGSGKIKFKHSYKRHNLRKRTKKAKRNLTKTGYINETEMPRVKMMLGL